MFSLNAAHLVADNDHARGRHHRGSLNGYARIGSRSLHYSYHEIYVAQAQDLEHDLERLSWTGEHHEPGPGTRRAWVPQHDEGLDDRMSQSQKYMSFVPLIMQR